MKKIVRDQAREMRRNGDTVTGIANALNVSKGTVSLWVRDIPLTEAQVEAIRVIYGAIQEYGGFEMSFG